MTIVIESSPAGWAVVIVAQCLVQVIINKYMTLTLLISAGPSALVQNSCVSG